MELVYLWVEDYKNIHHQGFNFSPRFECKFHDEYDEKGKLLLDCKLEINPKEHIKDFFGKNINVTAIVGKNGSGKSSILKILKKYINNIHHRKEPLGHGDGSNEWTKENEYYIDEKILIVFYSKKDGFYYQSSFKFDYIDHLFPIKEAIPLFKVSFPLFDYSLTYDKKISKMDEVFPAKYNFKNNQSAIVFDIEHSRNIENIIKNYFYLKNEFKIFKDFFKPRKLLLSIDLTVGFQEEIWKTEKKRELSYSESEELIQDYFQRNPIENITIEELSKKLSNDKMSNLIKEYLEKYPEERNRKIKKEKNYIYTVFEIDIDKLEYSQDEKSKKINELAYLEDEESLVSCDESAKYYEELIESSSFLEFSSLGEILEKEYFNLDLKDENDKSYKELSFGEQQLLNILNQIYSIGVKFYYYEIEYPEEVYYPEALKEIGGKHYYEDIKNFIIFLDEIDIGFHPNWQKRTIKYIIDFLSLIPDKNFHLIFTTHSPFLLSDIPKENIIFLNERTAIKQTFGANIHTLLSDSFFMEDGLMGEFAKNKIQEIMDFLNNKKTIEDISTKEKDIKQVIETIGEPFLKEKLLSMYNEKYPKTNNEKIAELEAEIQRLRDDKNPS